MATEGFFARIIQRVSTWLVRRADLAQPAPAVITPLIIQPGQETASTIPVFDLDSRIVNEDTVVRSDGSAGEPLHAARYEHGLWRVAWSDGRLGVDPESQNELIRAQAALAFQTRIVPVRKAFAEARATENARSQECSLSEQDWIHAKAEFDDVSAQQRRDPAEFSRLMGVVYFLFGIAVVIADIPLSLLVADALDIKIEVPRGSPHDLLNLIRHWNLVWEAALVALGVAALTIAFKLIIDRMYIRDHKSETWQPKARMILRVGTLTVAVLTTIYACWVMGRVRAAGGSPSDTDKQILFTILAILFPVVAAYCLSMARICSQNAKRLKLAAKERERKWRKYRAAIGPYEEAQAKRIEAEARLEAMKNQKIDEIFLRELYTHAYERGWSVPETRQPSASLYDRCEHLLHRSLARIEQFDNAV